MERTTQPTVDARPGPAPGETAASRDTSARGRRPALWLSLAVLAFDQLTKAIVRALLPVHASTTVVPGFLDFTHVQNTGAAFGFLNAAEFPFKAALLALVATLALVGIAIYAARLSTHQKVARFGLSLILGGAAGNLIDRLMVGYVVDFVDVYWRGYHFWAFNVADSAITIGVGMMLIDMLELGSHVSKTV
jgi:signal peptidase II